MSILTILLVLVVAGVVLWAINSYIPMDANVKKLLNVVAIIILVIWLLKAFGVFGYLAAARV